MSYKRQRRRYGGRKYLSKRKHIYTRKTPTHTIRRSRRRTFTRKRSPRRSPSRSRRRRRRRRRTKR